LNITSPKTGTNASILSIEDTPLFQQLIKIALEIHGYKVFEALDGRSGLALALSERPDLILLDLMMPGMDGAEVFRQIRADSRLHHIPVVVLSSSDDSNDIEECLQQGAADYLLKPFQPHMLVEVVRKCLPNKK
jgi:two-component system alkaline phosphatase synthesis response regulator PhoP